MTGAQAPAAALGLIRRLLVSGTSSQLRRNTLAGAASAIAGGAISAVAYTVYLHFLGYEQFGLWLSVAIVLSFAQFGNLGLAPAVTIKVAEDYAREDFEGVRGTVSTALLTLTAIGLAVLAAVLLFGGYIIGAMRLSAPLALQARNLLPFVAFLSLYVVQIETLSSVVVGLGRLDLSVGAQLVSRLMSLVISAVLLACGFGVVSLPIGTLVSYCFLHITSLYLTRRITGQSCFSLSSFDFGRLRRLAAFGGGVLTCSFINLLLGPLNKFALTRYAGPSTVPVYELAWMLGMQLRSVLETGLRGLIPEVSRLAALRTSDWATRVRRVNARAMKLILVAGLPVFAIALLFAPPIVRLWLGARFRPEIIPAIRLLLAGSFVSLLGVPGYYTLMGIKRLSHVIAGHSVLALTNATLLGVFALLGGTLSSTSVAAATATGLATGGLYVLFAAQIATRRVACRPIADAPFPRHNATVTVQQ
jgi:O-antigen/teichoic acid export membrane protein